MLMAPTQLIEGNDYEARQISLLYVFVGCLGRGREVDPAQNLEKYKKLLCVLIQLTNRNIAIT